MTRLMHNFRFVMIVLVSLFLGSTITSADVLTCKLTKMSKAGGYIPSKITVKYDLQSGIVELLKPTETRFGKLDVGEIEIDNEKRTTLKVKLKDVINSSNQYANMLFRLTWIKKTNRAIVEAKPLRYKNTWKAYGTCKKS